MNSKRFFLVLIVLIAIIGFVLTGCDTDNPGTPEHTVHDSGAWHTVSAKTCTVDGVRELRCTVCQFVLDTETETAEGHQWVAGENVTV